MGIISEWAVQRGWGTLATLAVAATTTIVSVAATTIHGITVTDDLMTHTGALDAAADGGGATAPAVGAAVDAEVRAGMRI